MLAFVSLVAPKRAIFVHINWFKAAFLEQLSITWQAISIKKNFKKHFTSFILLSIDSSNLIYFYTMRLLFPL